MEEKTSAPPKEPTPSDTPLETEERLSAWWVLGGIFALSLIMGVIAHRSLTYSVTSIKDSVSQFKRAGKALGAEQCATKTLGWARRCGAMQSLCDASVHRLMGSCLEGRSRKAFCAKVDLNKSKAHFTFAQCKQRKLQKNRRWKKICGGIYSALWIHCMYWRKGKIKLPAPLDKRAAVGKQPRK